MRAGIGCRYPAFTKRSGTFHELEKSSMDCPAFFAARTLSLAGGRTLARGATRKFMEALGQNSVQQKFPRIVDERRTTLLRSFASGSATEGAKGQS